METELVTGNIFGGEKALQARWEEKIYAVTKDTELKLPEFRSLSPKFGGRQGQHTEHLQPLLDEMGEVIQIDPEAEW